MVTPVPLRTHVRRWLTDRIVRGDYAPGTRVGVADLAGLLGVSPTPTREALTQLEREGLLRAQPNRGFFVAPLDLREARDLYPVLWTLEGLALRTQGALAAEQAAALRRLNGAMGDAEGDPERVLGLDEEWHRTLVQSCGNQLLLETIEELKRRALRFEYAFMRDSGRIPSSVREHVAVTDAALRGDSAKAALLLEAHWAGSLRFLTEWLAV